MLLLLIGVLVVVAGLSALGLGPITIRRLPEVPRSSLAQIGDEASALVEVHGKAAEIESMRAPLVDRPCVYWRARIVGISGGAIDIPLASDIDLVVADERGPTTVDPGSVELVEGNVATFQSPDIGGQPGADTILEPLRGRPWRGQVDVRWIEPGDAIWAIGCVEYPKVSKSVFRSLPDSLKPEVPMNLVAGTWGTVVVSTKGAWGPALRASRRRQQAIGFFLVAAGLAVVVRAVIDIAST